MIGGLAALAFRALFLSGEKGFRRAAWWAKAAFAASSLYAILSQRPEPALAVLAASAALGAAWPGPEWLFASAALSSIVAAWYSATALLTWLLASAPVGALAVASIFARTMAISLAIIFVGNSISPANVASALSRVSGRAPIYVLATWRLAPVALGATVESIGIGKLKGEGAGRRLAPAVAFMYEYGDRLEEYRGALLEEGVRGIPGTAPSRSYTAMLLSAALALAAVRILLVGLP
ncbi:MAG: hypothetical protein ABWK00_01705 [Desulfurococcaceae archaeon]